MTMSVTEEDLRSFQEYALGRINDAQTEYELEDLLDEWRTQNPNREQQEQDLLAIQEAITEWKAGDHGRPADEVIAKIRAKHSL